MKEYPGKIKGIRGQYCLDYLDFLRALDEKPKPVIRISERAVSDWRVNLPEPIPKKKK